MKDRLADYVEVADRIRAFIDKYPEGSLREDGAPEYRKLETTNAQGEVQTSTFIVYKARAYRTPDDPAPGQGIAWEPFPGKTPYTRDSELMNAQTSAWGRALAALGFIGKKIASAEEVKSRQSNGAERKKPSPLSESNRAKVLKAFADAGINDLTIYFTAVGLERVEDMTAEHAVKLRGLLDKELGEREAELA